MRTGHYTRLKGRVTYFRRKIPEFLQVRLESTEICYRLGVVSSKLAERLGRKLAVEVDMFFEDARTNPMLNATDLSQLVETAILGWRETANADIAEDVNRLGKPLTNPRDSATTMAEMGMALIQRSGGGASAFDAPFVTEMAEKAGLPAMADSVDVTAGGRALSMGLAAHYLQTAVTLASMHGLDKGWRGLPVADWQQRLAALEQYLGLDMDRPFGPPIRRQPQEPASAVVVEVAPMPILAATEHEIEVDDARDGGVVIFSALVKIYLDDRIDRGQVKKSIRDDMQSSLKIWTQVVGDHPISHYTRADFLAFRSVLQKMPKFYWRSEEARKLSILEVVEEAKKKAVAEWRKSAPPGQRNAPDAIERAGKAYVGLTNDTVNKHLSTIVPVFNWSVVNDKLPYDTRPFWNNLLLTTGVKITGLEEGDERPPFSHDQVRQIAEHPVWTGMKSAWFYNSPGRVIVRDSLYWGFPVAYLHGMRLEEFAQLKVKHVRQIDGIWVFDLHEIEVDVKQIASRRYVPIHSMLLTLGFLEAQVLGRPEEARLFEDLTLKGKSHSFGSALGKRFARVIDHIGITVIRVNGTDSDGGYHPLRHRFITDLLGAKVDGFVVAILTGHKPKSDNGQQNRYREKPTVAQLKEAIEMLPLAVDFEPWIDAWKRYGGAHRTRVRK